MGRGVADIADLANIADFFGGGELKLSHLTTMTLSLGISHLTTIMLSFGANRPMGCLDCWGFVFFV